MQKDSVDGRKDDNPVCLPSPTKYLSLEPPAVSIRRVTMLDARKGCHVVVATGTCVEKWLHHWIGT